MFVKLTISNLNRYDFPTPPPLISRDLIIICHRVTNGESCDYTRSIAVKRIDFRLFSPTRRNKGYASAGGFNNTGGAGCPSLQGSIARPARHGDPECPPSPIFLPNLQVRDKFVRVRVKKFLFLFLPCVCVLFSPQILFYRVWSLCLAGPCSHLAPRSLQPTDRQVSRRACSPVLALSSRPRILATGNQFLTATHAAAFLRSRRERERSLLRRDSSASKKNGRRGRHADLEVSPSSLSQKWRTARIY